MDHRDPEYPLNVDILPKLDRRHSLSMQMDLGRRRLRRRVLAEGMVNKLRYDSVSSLLINIDYHLTRNDGNVVLRGCPYADIGEVVVQIRRFKVDAYNSRKPDD